MTKSDALKLFDLKSNYTENEIKQIYRQLARKYHPDANGGKTTQLFMQIGEAYKILSSCIGESDCKLTHTSIFKFRKA